MRCIGIGLPVTTLDVTELVILAGEGPYLHIYDHSSVPSTRVSCKVLNHQVIHGIRKGPGSIFAVFGQKALNFVNINENSQSITVLSSVHEISDWIWDVCWLQSSRATDVQASFDLSTQDDPQGDVRVYPSMGILPGTSVAIATGHNAVLLWNVAKMCVVKSVHCQENCILYCAKFIGHTWDDVVLVAGTVFNQVVFWRPQGTRDATGRVVVDCRFKGHQGVIFNITYNPEQKLLATVSDDRSIRLWRYQHPSRDDTGEFAEEALCVLYGHCARVWCAHILSDKIVSVGEDATCCVWNMDGEIIKKFKSHKGKSIWSLAVQKDGLFVVTGGGDSSIRRWSLADNQPSASDTASSFWDVQKELGMFLRNLDESKTVVTEDLVPRILTISSNSQLLIMTQGGYLFSWSNLSSSYHLVMHDTNYRSYSVIASAPSAPLVAMGNIKGSIKMIVLDQHSAIDEKEVKAYDGNVVNLTWATNEDLFSTGLEGQLTWWKVQESPSLSLYAHAHFILPPCKQRWATSVTLIRDDQFVCGDRRGSVHLFQRNNNQKERPGPNSSVPGIHGKAGTSFVCQHDGAVYSTGRDGTYRRYAITDDGEIRLENTNKVYKGFEWLEKLVFTEDGDLHVLGFHSVNFVVWSTLNNEALLTVPCGGGHRAWDLAPLDDGAMTFVCIKTKQLLLHGLSSLAWKRQRILKDDIHGREITCVKFLRTIEYRGHRHYVCVTGSEDTKVIIVAFSSPESSTNPNSSPSSLGDIHVLHRLHAHVSSVRALAVCSSNSSINEMLVFSAGGRYSINCWRVTFCNKASHISSLKQICSVRHLVSHSSLITTRSRQKLKQREKLLDPETRFLGVTVWRRGETLGLASPAGGSDDVMVCVASSDALVRFFCFDENSCKLVFLGASNLHDSCLLCVTSVTFDFNASTGVKRTTVVATGGTNGRIVVWDVQEAEAIADRLSGDDGDDELEEGEEGYVTKDENMRAGAAAESRDEINSKLNNACSEPANIRTNTSKEIQSAINSNATLTSNQEVIGMLTREGDHGNAFGQLGGQGDCASAITTNSCVANQIHSAPAVSKLSSEGERDIHAVAMATMSDSTCHIEASNGDRRSWNMKQKGVHDVMHLGELSAISTGRQSATGNQANDVMKGHDDTRSIRELVSSWSAHQSGVNALALHHLTDNTWIVVSGGDDNAITVTLFDIVSLTSIAILDTYKIPTAHATQVTGICFIHAKPTFLSVSVDQRLNQWRILLSTDSLKIEEVRMVSSRFIHVSDVAAMDTWRDSSTGEQFAVICGQGLQLMDVTEDADNCR